MRRLLKPLWVLVALVFLLEVWLWEHLRPVVGWLVDLIPWRRLKERLAAAILRLPPYATLLVFVIPVLLLLPIKLLGLWMLAHGSWLGAMGTLALAKMVSVGITAFIFDLTRPKLLQLPWFRWLHDRVMVWVTRAHALIDPIKQEVREWIARNTASVRRRMRSLFWMMTPGRSGRFFRHLARVRRRMQRRAPAAA